MGLLEREVTLVIRIVISNPMCLTPYVGMLLLQEELSY